MAEVMYARQAFQMKSRGSHWLACAGKPRGGMSSASVARQHLQEFRFTTWGLCCCNACVS